MSRTRTSLGGPGQGTDAAATVARLREVVRYAWARSPFYREKLRAAGVDPEGVASLAEFSSLPFTTKEELRECPFEELRAAPEEEVVRVHASSGTTGKPVLIPYTKRDVEVWAELMARCLRLAGVTPRDRVQITPGYGLWTAGIGFQAGVEALGAMAIPTGPGNTERQLELLVSLRATVLIGTASYGLFLAEEVARRGLADKVSLRLGVFGSERWGDKMRARIASALGIDTFDIYGLTEVYGPGIAIDCPEHRGLHYWNDHLYFEVVDPETGSVLPPGEQGELVITTLTKEGFPLIRYRTRDITRLLPFSCPCGSPYPLIDRILGRSDEAFKVKGVLIYPAQIDGVLKETPGLGSEYQVILERCNGRDVFRVRVEAEPGADFAQAAHHLRQGIKRATGVWPEVEVVPYGTLPRSERKTRRVFDNRQL